ncbi:MULTISPECIES: M23 family metallopeptidase [unclassified Sphingomonas]|uniref:M23 family metallopeptidase n=1 Tax=unclassified Sphingomonas TaxID=196159 RepID=UPI0006F68BE3|nr:MULTISPECIES: M23 family metallopeptidase [unclassified Sphingomonas]KQX22751.1 peptidase M23 [Sphingomonas sp. Root1294]KQY67771.1 peptidase M23 [Sphingomonas sp. Root50]KRB88693.1 peptidase M23 [Sphingomonas sp. Root720]
MTGYRLLACLGLPLLLGAGAAAPDLVLPVACKLGRNCAIQNYVDRDPSPAASDFRCGSRTYDKHSGIDFRLVSMAEQRRGVAVLAAADGKVLRVRDGVADISVREAGKAGIANMECGNGLVIGHAGGLETQYCHMAKGSIAVKPGQAVKAGAPIGKVGLSGNTEYPHLHFTVRLNGKVVEPFAVGAQPGRCDGGRSLWSPSAGLAGAYKAGEVLNAGFSTGPMTMPAVQENGSDQPRPTRSAPALVAFVQAIGLKGRDVQKLVLTAPDGSVLAENRAAPLDRDKAQWLSFTGKKRRGAAWPAGRYQAHYTVLRGGKAVIDRRFDLLLK